VNVLVGILLGFLAASIQAGTAQGASIGDCKGDGRVGIDKILEQRPERVPGNAYAHADCFNQRCGGDVGKWVALVDERDASNEPTGAADYRFWLRRSGWLQRSRFPCRGAKANPC